MESMGLACTVSLAVAAIHHPSLAALDPAGQILSPSHASLSANGRFLAMPRGGDAFPSMFLRDRVQGATRIVQMALAATKPMNPNSAETVATSRPASRWQRAS